MLLLLETMGTQTFLNTPRADAHLACRATAETPITDRLVTAFADGETARTERQLALFAVIDAFTAHRAFTPLAHGAVVLRHAVATFIARLAVPLLETHVR